MTWGDYQLHVGDETWLYYGGYARGHKVERLTERQIGLARMKRDRYVARSAGPEGGTFRMPPMMIAGSRMTVNADIRGELRIRLYNAEGRRLPSIGEVPIQGDSLAHPVRTLPLDWFKEKPVQIEFRMRDARVFGFELV